MLTPTNKNNGKYFNFRLHEANKIKLKETANHFNLSMAEVINTLLARGLSTVIIPSTKKEVL